MNKRYSIYYSFFFLFWFMSIPTELQCGAIRSNDVLPQTASSTEAAAILETINHSNAYTPIPTAPSEEPSISLNLEDTDLSLLVQQIAEIFEMTFITDDVVNPLAPGGKSLKGNKVSFRTHDLLTKAQAWNLFLRLLDISGFAIIPDSNPKTFRIVATAQAQRAPVPAYLGVDPESLPDNDQIVRYLYFTKPGRLDAIDPIIQALRSPASAYLVLKDINAFVLTDKAYNIKSLMRIIIDMDRLPPESISVLKLRRANAQDVKLLYDALTKTDEKVAGARAFPVKKQSSAQYFPENARIFAEPRTNTLIILGSQDAIKKIENFIITNIDVELGVETRSPIHIHQLKYAEAKTIAEILSEVSQFGKNTPVGKAGGVRDGDKYLKNMSFTAEPTTNKLIIRGDYEDFLQVRTAIEELDQPQPQVSVEILILTIDIGNTKALGTQLRSKTDNAVSKQGGHSGLTGPNVKFQTSGINFGGGPKSFVINTAGTGVERLLGDLINLAVGGSAGSTAITLGSDAFGVWGIFNILSSITSTQVVANPFFTVSNKQKSLVEVGIQRRVISGETVSGDTKTPSFSNDKATITVEARPQINSDGMIILDLRVSIEEYLDPDPASATKSSKEIKTFSVLADKEVLALGGLIRNKIDTNSSRWPILGNIPILGWLFKNKTKTQAKSSLLILVSTQIIPADSQESITPLTRNRMNEYTSTLVQMADPSDKRDPVGRFFFKQASKTEDALDTLLFDRKQQAELHNQEEAKRTAQPIIKPTVVAGSKKRSKKRRSRKKSSNDEVLAA